MPLKSNEDGSYVASWVPSTSGSYIIQVFIDGKSAGTRNTHTISRPRGPINLHLHVFYISVLIKLKNSRVCP